MSMSTIYNVVTRYRLEDRGAGQAISGMERRIKRLERRADRARRRIQGLATGLKIAFGVAAAGGIAMAGRELVGLSKRLQEAEISLATVFDANRLNDFEGGLKRAKKLTEEFRDTAAVSPGSQFDFIETSKAMLPALAQADPTDEEINRLTAQTVGASESLMGGDTQQASMDMQRILSGSAAFGENRLFTLMGRQMMEQVGAENTEEFNKIAKSAGGTRKILEAVTKAFKPMEKANEEFADSFVGQWSTLRTYVEQTILGAGGVFDQVTDTLGDINEWFRENEDQVMSFAEKVGDGLAKAFEQVTNAVTVLLKNLDVAVALLGAVAAKKGAIVAGDFAALAATGAPAQMAGDYLQATMGVADAAKSAPKNVAGGVREFAAEMLMGDQFGKRIGRRRSGRGAGLAKRVKGGASKLGSFLMSDPGTYIDALESRRKAAGGLTGMAKKGAGAALGGAAKGVTALVGGLTTLASVLGPLVVVVGMVVGTFQVLRDRTNFVTNFLMEQWGLLMEELDKLAAQFGGDGGFVSSLKSFTRWLGEGVVGTLGFVTMGVRKLIEGLNMLLVVIKGISYGLHNLYDQFRSAGGGLSGLQALDPGEAFGSGFAAADAQYEKRKKEQEKRRREEEKKRKEEEKRKKREREKEQAAQDGSPKVEVTLNQENHTDADPDRIAFRTLDLVQEAFEGRKVSVPNTPFRE